MTPLPLATSIADALRARVRRAIDLAIFVGGSLGSLIGAVDIVLGTSKEPLVAIAVMVALASCGLLGLMGRAPWTPVAFVMLALVANAVYLVVFGPWMGLGVIYILAMALAFLFMSPRWSWIVSITLAATPLMVGVLFGLGLVPHASVLSVENERQWLRACVAAITGMIGIGILVRFTVAQLVKARDDLERAAITEREQHVERERVDAEIGRARRAESIAQLGAEVASDIGAALAIIEAKARALAAELRGDGAKDCLGDILEAASTASSTMRSLTMFAPDSYVATRGNATDAARALPKLVRRMIPHRIALDITSDEDAWVGIGTTDLARILANLTLNARDAIAEAGTITVQVRRTPAHVEIDVRDTGSGMSADVLAHLFQPFFTTKAIGRGTGLGLATTKIHVERANGTISVESELDVGTRFLICLPHHASRGSMPAVA